MCAQHGPLPTLIGSGCSGSHNLNLSNRSVRTRMPGGAGGGGQVIWPTSSRLSCQSSTDDLLETK